MFQIRLCREQTWSDRKDEKLAVASESDIAVSDGVQRDSRCRQRQMNRGRDGWMGMAGRASLGYDPAASPSQPLSNVICLLLVVGPASEAVGGVDI